MKEQIVITEENTKITYLYNDVKEIKEEDNLVTIYFKNEVKLFLFSDKFTKGTWNDCKIYLLNIIETKTGEINGNN